MSNPKDLLGKTVMYRNKAWQVVGVTVNAFGIFLQLENGIKKVTARMEEVEI